MKYISGNLWGRIPNGKCFSTNVTILQIIFRITVIFFKKTRIFALRG